MRKECLVITLFSCLLFSCITDEKEGTETFIEVGSTLPSFTVSSVDGTRLSYDKSVGKVVLIVFFITTCSDCSREMPKAESVWLSLKDEPDFILLPIARAQSEEVVKAYWETNSFSMPAYLDPDRAVYSLFAESIVPRFYLADKRGVVQWVGVESFDEDSEDIKARIEELLRE